MRRVSSRRRCGKGAVAVRVRNNGPARRSYNSYRVNTGALSKNLEKLSTGYKINRSADDAAGLSISEKMRASITGLGRAQTNAKEGIGLIQVTEGALQEYHEIVNRMLELSVKSANATYDDDVDREQLQKEMNRLAQELNRIADSTNFNGIFTLNGSGELVEDAEFRELVEKATLHGGDAEEMAILLGEPINGEKPTAGSDFVYGHYHSDVLKKKEGENQQWTFGGFSMKPFNSDDLPSITDQIRQFAKEYNSDPTNDGNGWKARLLPEIGGYVCCFLPYTESDSQLDEYAPRRPEGAGERLPLPLDGDGLHGEYASGAEQKAVEGSPAKTSVDFQSTTGEDMMGAVMLLGGIGEYGKYQFAENADDVANGYSAIIIEDSFTSTNIARAVFDTVEAPSGYHNQMGGYTATQVIFKEEAVDGKYQGLKALPISVSFFKSPETAEEAIDQATANAKKATLYALQTDNVRLQIGETGDEYNFLDVPIFDMHTDKVGLAGVDISTQNGALNAIDKIKSAISKVSDVRGTHGALQNRLEHAIHYLGVAHENAQSSESVIRDTDMADEMMKYTKNSILTQSAQAMMAQANMLPEGVLRLLQ